MTARDWRPKIHPLLRMVASVLNDCIRGLFTDHEDSGHWVETWRPRVTRCVTNLSKKSGQFPLDSAKVGGYTPGMKTAVSVPDEVFEEAEKLAKRLKVSRSELYAKALENYVRQHSPDAVTEAYNGLCDSEPSRDFARRAVRKSLEKVEW